MDHARPSPDGRALLRADFARLNAAMAALRYDGRRRANLLRSDLPSDPDTATRDNRFLFRDVGAVTGWYDFWEPRGWRIVEPPRPSRWRRLWQRIWRTS